ncbi:MAG TPA: acyltransferase, partial [Rhizorhapis sp.]|nr:acyltransferase [Rhizorhapis sp.]
MRHPTSQHDLPTVESPRAIGQLTSLRFFAALAVLLSHLAFLGESRNGTVKAVYDGLFHEGYVGVSFFYILSGFIISHAYGDRICERQISAREYFAYRMARILPLHWLVALPFLLWLLIIKNDAPGWPAILLNLSLLQAFVPEPTIHYSLNAPSWSLSCEIFFYLMFPLLVVLRTRILAALTMAGMAVMGAAAAYWVAKGNQPSAMAEWFFYINPPTRLIDFIVGMLIYRAARAGTFPRLSGTFMEVALVLLIPSLMILLHWA